MLPMLDVGVPSERPHLGRESGVHGLPFLEEVDDMPTFATLGSAGNQKRVKATGDGIYTIGKSQFKIRKGDLLPLNYDEVFYREPDARGDALSTRIAERLSATKEENVAEEGDEETTDEGGETAALPRRGRRKSS